jgi:CheY-like chemotaxis protein
MSEEFLSEMFKPFTRENRSLSEIEGGNGLGMSIVKILVDTMEGTIDCQSEKNKGTTFIIEFDCDLSSEKEYLEYLDNSKNIFRMGLNGKKLLLCEDVEINIMIVKKLLDNLGVSIDVAKNGLIGVENAKKNFYDVIIMDIRMPIMDGLEAASEIREFNNDVPIIALSANAYKEDIEKSYENGMNAHLSKPVMRNELIETIISLCEG